MDLFNLLGKIDLPEIKESDFKDEERDLYYYFIEKFNSEEGLVFPLIIGNKFKEILFLRKNPTYIEKVKKAIEDVFEKNPNKNKMKFEQIKFSGEDFIEKIPLLFFIPEASPANVLSKRAQRKYSIRTLIYDLFPLYLDDKIYFNLSFHGKLIHEGSGNIENCFIPTEKIETIKVSDSLEMLSLKIKLEAFGESRTKHQISSRIFDTDQEKAFLLSKDQQLSLFKDLDFNQFMERSKIFNINFLEKNDHNQMLLELKEKLIPTDFNAKSITHLRFIFNRFSHFDSNEKLLDYNNILDIQLTKMKNWLDRSFKDGINGYYK